MVDEANVSFDALRLNNERKKKCLVIYFNNLFGTFATLTPSLARSVALAVSVTLAFAPMRRRMCTNVL